ncbi:GNAT family N-acetyltransferase [Undibacterium sp. LX40W]|uniref:GNAT family N-acetyltransferase n=1 Tax=Undibacterium nitidum TaxID=2762298 RepID=A0A923HX94_9BURK|nr:MULTISPECIES: GNAT family N-acetyltransferase [Undibacterium]MBC3881876.1 GNAT family N-acetyltransferase [Undibacterium nitidum]MBC3892127.1 GNAT family N-acetyltransferase [Undibacterium sp. LX40W]
MLHLNKHEHLPDFIRLNEQWISEYFALEEVDRALAANPAAIIDEGGFIFTMTDGDEVVACCALFKSGEYEFELARMAVSPKRRGGGLGRQLIEAAISKAIELKAKRVYLVSNTKLESAIALYQKTGFVTVSLGQHPVYARANIEMERVLP